MAEAEAEAENGNDGPPITKRLNEHATITFKAHSLGCYKDTNIRDLPGLFHAKGDVNLCFLKAIAGGFKYASLQAGS